MKLWAIRGVTNYAEETEVEKLMSKFYNILIKYPQSTSYNYQEYEQIRSVFGLPYLIERFVMIVLLKPLNRKKFNIMQCLMHLKGILL